MKRRVPILILIVLVLLSFSPVVSIAGASDTIPGTAGLYKGAPANAASFVNDTLPKLHGEKASMSSWEKKVSSTLLTSDKTGFSTKTLKTAGATGGTANVYVTVDPSVKTNVIDSLTSSVTDRDETNHIAVARVPLSGIQALASRSEVRSVRPVIPPFARKGSVTAESNAILRTDALQALGKKGAGVKVGVISTGAANYATAVTSGDLPTVASGKLNILDIGYGNEGTDMMEIIHDMAPDATLYFHYCGDNHLQFIHAMDELVAKGCTVIVDDIGWYDEPYFQDGIIAQHVRYLISTKNIVYVSAAGNDADVHYQGQYYPQATAGFETFHDFSFDGSMDPTYPNLYVTMPAGSSVAVFLQWDDYFRDTNCDMSDYDLYLVDEYMDLLGASLDGVCTVPEEFIFYTNEGSTSIETEILVNKYWGSDRNLEVFIWPLDGATVHANNIIPYDSVFGHPAVGGVLAVGAIDAADSGNNDIEPFSSLGPFTYSDPTGSYPRFKPDITGIDGVLVSLTGESPFFGTSASAAGIAAIAADLRGAFPAKNGQEIANLIRMSATDLGTYNPDVVYGFGRADALSAYYKSPGSATAYIRSNPPGATLYIDGMNQGTTPKVVSGLSEGFHTIYLTKTNFEDQFDAVFIANGGNFAATYTMMAIAGSSTSGVSEVEGNPDQIYMGLYVTPSIYWATMNFGDNEAEIVLDAIAPAGVPYSISAGDKLDGTKPAATKGRMAEFRYSNAYLPIGWAAGGKVFKQPIRVNTSEMLTERTLTGTTDPIIFTDLGNGKYKPRVVEISQFVTTSDVPVSASGEIRVYKIPITFTMTAL